MSETQQLSLLLHWEGCTQLTFDLCLKMPKRARFSFVSRLEGLTLDLLMNLTQAKYQNGIERLTSLQSADQKLAQLKILARLAHGRTLIAHSDFETLSRSYDETGRMLGGWLKSESKRLI